jgi:O-antigen/teichoic acid export membrane protein
VRSTFRGFLTLSPLTLATAGAALVQNKVLAIVVGPAGVGFYGLALTLATLFSTIGALGISAALMKRIAEIGGTDRESDTWATALLGIGTVVVVSLLLSALVILNYHFVADLFLNSNTISDSDKRFIVIASAVGILPAALVPTMGGFLRGLRSLREYVTVGIIGAIVLVASIVVGALVADARGAFIGFLVGEVINAAALFAFALHVARRRGLPFTIRLERRHLAAIEKVLLALGILAVVAGLGSNVGQAVARSQIANAFDLRAVGFFAAAWAISNRVPSLIYQTFTSYLMPEISALRQDWESIVRIQNDACRISLLAVTPVLTLAIAAGPWVVSILLSGSFHPMVNLLRLMFIGELISVIAWAGGSALYPSGRPVSSAFFEWSFWAIFVAGVFVAAGVGELNVVGGAYIVAEAALVAMIYVWERRHHDFRWSPRNLRLIALSLLVISASAVLAMLSGLPTVVVVVLVAALLAVWAVTAVHRSEWALLRNALRRRRERG